MDETAQRIVSALEPADGWWKPSTEDTLLEVTETLLGEGVDEEVISESLESVMGALRAEYGE